VNNLPGPNPKTDREYRAMNWARDALKTAKSATDYVRGLDNRLRNASQAHADVRKCSRIGYCRLRNTSEARADVRRNFDRTPQKKF
jgi:hypothetical protein